MAEDKPETAGETADAAIELSPEVLQMADGCFERAEQAVQRGNFDYAVALYLEGIRYNPQDTERGHRGLREVALKKAAQGGGAGFGALMKQIKATYYQMLGRHKDAMLALEAHLTTKPNDVSALAAMMQSARKNGYPAVAIWFGELAVDRTLKSKKPNKQLLITMAGLYEHGKQFRKAVDILSEAIRVDPGDRSLDKWLRDMSASGTIDDGKLDSVTDFHDMIRDKAQAAESASQKVVRTEEQFLQREKELRQELEQDPASYNAMGQLADVLVRLERIDEALDLYKEAMDISKDFRFKMRMDDVQSSRYRRQLVQLDEELAERPQDQDLTRRRAEVAKKRADFELGVYQERFEHYPTNMGIRYELGMRQYAAALLDKAISSFQQSMRDPKRRIQSINMLGRCFFVKKLYQEAAGQFQTAIESYELTGDPLWKELRYNLALTHEAMGASTEAIGWYSEIVQVDYQYRDAAKRLESLRQKAPQEK